MSSDYDYSFIPKTRALRKKIGGILFVFGCVFLALLAGVIIFS